MLALYFRLEAGDPGELGLLSGADGWYVGSPDSTTIPASADCSKSNIDTVATIDFIECSGKAEAVSFTKYCFAGSLINNVRVKISIHLRTPF